MFGFHASGARANEGKARWVTIYLYFNNIPIIRIAIITMECIYVCFVYGVIVHF